MDTYLTNNIDLDNYGVALLPLDKNIGIIPNKRIVGTPRITCIYTQNLQVVVANLYKYKILIRPSFIHIFKNHLQAVYL